MKHPLTEGPRAHLEKIVQWHRDQSMAMPFALLRSHQESPWASLSDGAGAQVYLALHTSTGSEDTEALLHALEWLLQIHETGRERAAFYYPEVPGSQGLKSSFYNSSDALLYLYLMICHRLERVGEFNRVLPIFLQRSLRKVNVHHTELMFGLAGYLNATLSLFRHTHDPGILEASNVIAGDILLRGVSNAPAKWTVDPCYNFSHGRSGVFHALLNWSFFTGQALPEWFYGELQELADAIEDSPSLGVPVDISPNLRRSWCRGTAGHAMLWARAYEVTRQEVYKHRAWRAANYAHTGRRDSPGNNSLCCGLAGRAYALLAMDRIAPGSGWYGKALELALIAISQVPSSTHYFINGLYRGHGGLICLAYDLLLPPEERVGYPLVEG